jgi:DNA-binding transcriptional MerR regulator
LRLADIRELLALRESGACPCEPAASLLRQRLQRLDTELARLTELRNELAAFVAGIPAADCPEPSPGTWRPREEVSSMICRCCGKPCQQCDCDMCCGDK